MPEAEESIGTQLAKLDGKIDLLSTKLDAHRDLLMAEMKAGDRESGQAIALTNERVSTLASKVDKNSSRLDVMEDTRLTALERAVEPITTLTKLVYGFVALVLIAVVSGLLALVLKGGA